ncbi:hypothetical protein ScPMuIL_001852 [Solemya velum]
MGVPAALVCNGFCMNGGTGMLSISLYGNCRCWCRERFFGPRCEFGMGKRGTRRLRRLTESRDSIERIMRHRKRKLG